MRLIVLPCDGIGPEIVGASVDVLRSANDVFSLGLSHAGAWVTTV